MKQLIILWIFLTPWFTLIAGELHDPTVIASYTSAEEKVKDNSFFDKDELFVCDLTFNIKKLNKEKAEENYQEAKLTFYLNDSVKKEMIVRLKARGIFRKDHCHLPPIKINIDESDIQSGVFKGINEFKLVTCCRYSKSYDKYVLKEYLAYKLYNLFTDYSLRVRLMKIRYIDTGRRKPKEHIAYSFAIEDIDMLAERNNAIEIEVNTLNQDPIYRKSMDRVALFNFMIGNTDWSVPGLHNLKLIKLKDPFVLTPIVIPYDFDYSGFVNTHYAIPDERLGIDNVRERVFRGLCRTREEHKATIQEFLDKKDKIYQTILEFEYLNERTKKEVLSYIDDFYRIIESENLTTRHIYNSCKD